MQQTSMQRTSIQPRFFTEPCVCVCLCVRAVARGWYVDAVREKQGVGMQQGLYQGAQGMGMMPPQLHQPPPGMGMGMGMGGGMQNMQQPNLQQQQMMQAQQAQQMQQMQQMQQLQQLQLPQ
jgi:hypothetical protein